MQHSRLKKAIAPIITVLIFASCVNTTVRKTASFDLAMAMNGPEDCSVYKAGDPGKDSEKSMVAYVAVIAFGGTEATDEYFIERGTQKLRKYKPDVIVTSQSSHQNVGSVHSFSGGMGMSMPVTQKQITLWGMRYTPAKLGLKWDRDSFMVTSISNSALYDAGLLEGDTVLSLDGNAFPKTAIAKEAWNARYLSYTPGQEVEIIWIRPGEGRKAAKVTFIIND